VSDIGVIGLAVMGSNLARNIESRGYKVSVFNRTKEVTDQFMKDFSKENNFYGAGELLDFVKSLKKPRKMIIMVKAGAPTDAVIDSLINILDKDDLIIDGGNAWYLDTIRRENACKEKGINFIGMGISGGEEGALHGPSTMPGGPKEAWSLISELLNKISAKVGSDACTTYIGPDGAGHFVKMVHNGIEYADMQLIAEVYHVLQEVAGLSAIEISKVFEDWNKGPLNSFLIEITAQVLKYKDPETGNYLVDLILDQAGQKGTGRWTSQVALDLGVPAPTISAAVDARVLSSIKNERILASKVYSAQNKNVSLDKNKIINLLHSALYVGKIIAYAQGVDILCKASEQYKWNLNISEIAGIWRGGCIIRAALLSQISTAFKTEQNGNLLLKKEIQPIIKEHITSFRELLSYTAQYGVPTLALSSALSYFDSYRSENLPQNLTQAQRDFFGAHTFERKDKEGTFHVKWS
jgi:6-phosphogluconate dehydrogenase